MTPKLALRQIHEDIAERYWQDHPIEALMQALSDGTDTIIVSLFQTHFPDPSDVCLYAVGGYGRAELHPGSDIDLLVVVKKPDKHRAAIESFIQNVFDLNVEVGHSVRTPTACRDQAKADLTVATAMLERRLLAGDPTTAAKVDKAMSSKRLWPTEKFFKEKFAEQDQRHKHYDNIDYNLEPNIKTSPGGLRDIQTVQWVCLREFGTHAAKDLVTAGVLTPDEAKWLADGKQFVNWVRFGMHLLAERKEDQLQFALQRELAERHGFVDTKAQRGVERFMHAYYRHILALTEVNDIVRQHFTETVVHRGRNKIEPINDRFSINNGYMQAQHDKVFQQTPKALLELFVIMANRTDINGVRADTIRQVRDSLDLIDDAFRQNEDHTRLFIDLLKAPFTLVSQLTRMRRYGVLGRYIPEFGKIVGQMQHDLFHAYTVDAHTMTVIRNMRRFRYRSAREKYPIAYHCVHHIPKIELLYIAGLYHDIGKGRGGDHSVLGAVDAEIFCQRHGLSDADTELVTWLVKKHLYMSAVSQRQDIYDPDVVYAFASEIKSEMRLDYLYALTVADINATNPNLWNSWRATLLQQLYLETRKVLRRGLESPADKAATIAAYQERAMERMPEGYDLELTQKIWRSLGEDFFLRHTPGQIASITQQISQVPYGETCLYTGNIRAEFAGSGATMIYIFTKDQPHLFANTAVTLSQHAISVVDATINTGPDGMCFDTYTVLNQEGLAFAKDDPLLAKIVDRISKSLQQTDLQATKSSQRIPRKLKELHHPTEVTFSQEDDRVSTLTIIASDRPGLLAHIAQIFVEMDIQIQSAKITTLGERVEDTFIILNQDGTPISEGERSYELTHAIRQRLDRTLTQQI